MNEIQKTIPALDVFFRDILREYSSDAFAEMCWRNAVRDIINERVGVEVPYEMTDGYLNEFWQAYIVPQAWEKYGPKAAIC